MHSAPLPGFADGDQQTEVNHTLPSGGRYVALTICRRKVGVVPPEKIGAKNLLPLFGFPATSTLNGEYLVNEMWHIQSRKGLLRCRKNSWTLVHKRLRTGPEFLPTLTISFCHSPSHTVYAALTWLPTATLDETHWVCLQLRFGAQKMLSWKLYRVGRP